MEATRELILCIIFILPLPRARMSSNHSTTLVVGLAQAGLYQGGYGGILSQEL